MMRVVVASFVLWLAAGAAHAQEPAPAPTPAADSTEPQSLCPLDDQKRWRFETIAPGHDRSSGEVEISCQNGQLRIFADVIDFYHSEGSRLVATGNVVFRNPEGQITSERVEFNLEDGTGTFEQAWGVMSLGENADLDQFGDHEPHVYFYGDVIEKTGGRQYKISRGAFTTCLQPTPRWELVSSSLTINLNDYAIGRNTVLRVKGVPIFYAPIIYYPIQDDERATGFLLPSYGTSTYRGQAVSNAFFWALGRSHDATFFHDWFTQAGQGAGTEYRYVAGSQSQGTFRLYRFSRKETSLASEDAVTVLPANTSFELTGNATHAFTPRLRARVRLDYFSDVTSQQLLHQNVYEASRSNRTIEGLLSGTFGRLSTSVLYQRHERLNGTDDTTVYGNTPRITANIAPQQLFGSRIYASLNTEYAFQPYRRVVNNIVRQDDGVGRIDATPTLRIPLSRLSFLSVNTSATYRTTYYTRSANPSNLDAPTVGESFLRTYGSVRTDVVGPVLTRIWDLPQTSFAERLKHVIEPTFSVDLISRINDYRRAPVRTDISDFIVGGSMSVTYGITNRLLYRGRSVDGRRGQTREFVTVGIQQTYYSNPETSLYDTAYQSTSAGNRQRDLSPIAMNVRVSPNTGFDADTRLEYDVAGNGLTSVSTGASMNFNRSGASLNYSRRRYRRTSDPDNYLTASTRVQLGPRQTQASYSLNWDISNSYVVSQSMMLSYMAQCCGFQVEFQQYNFRPGSGLPLPSDRRFNFGFVLAGLGTFSNFFGAFGGGGTR